MARSIESAGAGLSETFFEPSVRLGVTGLARSGKTVFITSLVANLLEPGRMPQLRAAASGRIRSSWLQPQPDDTLPRFDYEDHLAAMTSVTPRWPEPTHALSELRLSLRLQPESFLAGLTGQRTLHIDIVDYPGEWLLDLALLQKDYRKWSAQVLARAQNRPGGPEYLAAAANVDPAAAFDELTARSLAAAWTEHLRLSREAGYSDCSPGRFTMPGDLKGSPALTFAPLPAKAGDLAVPSSDAAAPGRGSLWREMERRYDAYCRRVVKPFFTEHLSRIDRQVVLADVLKAVNAGPRAFEDMRQVMGEILACFRPGKNGFLRELVLGKRVEKLLFAATKADHLHHSQHSRLAALTAALVDDARRRADHKGAQTTAMAIAAVRATIEETRSHEGADWGMVRGTDKDGKLKSFFPGELPEDITRLLSAAREGAELWPGGDFGRVEFRPATQGLRPGEGLPHIRMDRAAEFLLGDLL